MFAGPACAEADYSKGRNAPTTAEALLTRRGADDAIGYACFRAYLTDGQISRFRPIRTLGVLGWRPRLRF